MSSGELLVIAVVALVVFGPGKLPMLARHLATLFAALTGFKRQLNEFWQAQLAEQKLLESQRKAQRVDKIYADSCPSSAKHDAQEDRG